MGNPFKNENNTVAPKKKEVPTPVPAQAAVDPEEKVAEKATPKKKEAKKNPLAGILDEKPEGKGYSLFLDVDVIEELDKLAKGKKGLSRSKIANALLRKGLFGE